MLKILDIAPEPLLSIPCVNCAPGGRGVEYRQLPTLHARAEGLPDGLDALIVASDLQAYDTDAVPANRRRLIGHVLAEELGAMAELGMLPDPVRMGVLLAGDLYAIASLRKRGGLGDADPVWESFLEQFRWVAGVAGNHDSFKGRVDFDLFPIEGNRYPLHGDVVEIDGLRVAGISGIIGTSGKSWRVAPAQWERLARRVLEQEPDVFLLHQGPGVPEQALLGHALVNEVLARFNDTPLVVCGHAHWDVPLATTAGAQILNVDYRAVVITRA